MIQNTTSFFLELDEIKRPLEVTRHKASNVQFFNLILRVYFYRMYAQKIISGFIKIQNKMYKIKGAAPFITH
jgi:hypothetical protein